MKLITRIKAFFRWKNQNAQLEVSAAEIRQGKVFLHPVDDEEHVYCMKADMVDIIINPHKDIRDEDVQIFKRKKPAAEAANQTEKKAKEKGDPTKPRKEKEPRQRTGESTYTPRPISYYMPKMKTVSFVLYEDEYESLMNGIKTNGYRKTEFLLACVDAAKKNSMEATYRRYTAEHKARRAADREAAKIAQQEEFQAQQLKRQAGITQ